MMRVKVNNFNFTFNIKLYVTDWSYQNRPKWYVHVPKQFWNLKNYITCLKRGTNILRVKIKSLKYILRFWVIFPIFKSQKKDKSPSANLSHTYSWKIAKFTEKFPLLKILTWAAVIRLRRWISLSFLFLLFLSLLFFLFLFVIRRWGTRRSVRTLSLRFVAAEIFAI